MNDLIIKNNVRIEDLIYEVRDKQVMLAADVAKLYEVETKRLNETIKRNINRFPKSFCFQLTNKEIDQLFLRSQFTTLNKSRNMRGQHYKFLPYVLTEQGIMMLSGLLKSDIAIKVNLMIIEAFVSMRKYIANNNYNKRISNIEINLIEHDNKINQILNKLNSKEKYNHIFFEGQIYDAYSLMINILNKARKEIIIIDNYAGKELFDLIKEINVEIKIYSKNIDEKALVKYRKQYQNIEIIYNGKFHDRFIIIDRKILYHCGASFKDLGDKCFGINLIEDQEVLKNILNIL